MPARKRNDFGIAHAGGDSSAAGGAGRPATRAPGSGAGRCIENQPARREPGYWPDPVFNPRDGSARLGRRLGGPQPPSRAWRPVPTRHLAALGPAARAFAGREFLVLRAGASAADRGYAASDPPPVAGSWPWRYDRRIFLLCCSMSFCLDTSYSVFFSFSR